VRKALLACGALAPLIYIGADIVAARRYAGYSFADQAVSELFAIGAPTSRLVVELFSVSSLLYAALALGVASLADRNRALRAMAWMILANAVDSLLLWNLFPMHMRGVEPTFTDTMHAILAINPFVLLTLVIALFAFRGWFRYYTLATIVLLLAPATLAFSYVPALFAHEPTPWLGLAERAGQYAHQLWHAALSLVLLAHEPLRRTR
jgi:hypothetical protein